MRDRRRRWTTTAATATALALAFAAPASARAPHAVPTAAAHVHGPDAAPGARSRVTRLEVRGRQALAGGYERVLGVAHGVVAGGEPVRGLPAGGVRYDAEFEVLRPRRGARAPRPRMLLVEAENRGSPLLLGALTGFEPTVTGAPSTARHPAATGRVLRRLRVAYARVQWQTGLAAGVPATAQGAGEVVVRDVGRALGRGYPGGRSPGSARGRSSSTPSWPRASTPWPAAAAPTTGRSRSTGTATGWPSTAWPAPAPRIRTCAPTGARCPTGASCAGRATDPLLVDVANLTDFHRLRAGLTDARRPPRGVLRYDWPSPHQSFPPAVVFAGLRCNGGVPVPLNPLRYEPYLRALVRGVARGRPPRPRRFRLGRQPPPSPSFNALPGVRVPVPRTDADGQPVGGVRFPEVDLPLGRLEPASLSPSVTTSSGAVCGNSGGFTPFPPAAVAARGSQARYVARFDRALRRLVSGGYVLAADRPGMLARAAAASRAARGG